MDVDRDYAGGFGIAHPSERDDYGHGKFAIPYVSLMYSAGLLRRQGCDIIYVDAQAERLSAETTITKVRRLRPDIIVTVVSLPSIYADGDFLRRLRIQCPHSKLICIGTVCLILPDVLAKMNVADVIIVGEPESVLPNLVRRLQESSSIEKVRGIGIVQDGRLSRTESSTERVNLRSLPWPPHDIMPIALYRDPHFGVRVRFFPVWGSRGCPMPCSFYCPYPIGVGRTIRLRSCDDFVNEIAHLNRIHGVKAFIFRDQIFSSRLDRAEEICELLIEKKLRIQWVCETRLDRVSERLLRKMRKAGCRRINFGLETGDPILLHKIGKPGMKISTVKRAVRLTKEAGIRPVTHLIIGLPGESPDTVRRTFKTLRYLGIADVSANIATPYPGTKLFQYARDHELLETEDWSQYTSFKAVMRTEWMNTLELQESKALFATNLLGTTRNLLGTTFFEKITYLCKSRLIVDALRTRLKIAHDWPLILMEFLRDLPFQMVHDIAKGRKEI